VKPREHFGLKSYEILIYVSSAMAFFVLAVVLSAGSNMAVALGLASLASLFRRASS
jgi:hypothetical protein